MSVPTDLRYTKDHEWVRLTGDEATIGITAYAADQLGDIVFVELPDAGRSLGRGIREFKDGLTRNDVAAPSDEASTADGREAASASTDPSRG